jgi:hypothetical protein
MAGQSAPEDHAAILLPAELHGQDTVFMVRVQRRFRSWGLMVRSAKRVSNHEAPILILRPHPSRRLLTQAPHDEGIKRFVTQ